MNGVSILTGVVLGACIGWVHLRSLQLNVTWLVSGRRWQANLGLFVLRLAVIVALLYWLAKAGVSLIAVLAGMLLVRVIMLRKDFLP